MAAPRKYSDAQRQELFRLHEAGLTSEQASEACARGTGGVAPFTISRRTVSDIVARMAREASIDMPSTLGDVDSLATVQRFPERISRIVDAEIERLDKKQRRGKLTCGDIEQLKKAAEVSGPLSRRLEGVVRPMGRAGSGTRNGSRPAPKPESAIDKLAREQQQQKATDGDGPESIMRLSRTRTPQETTDLPQKAAAAALPVPVSVPTAASRPAALVQRRQEVIESMRRTLSEGGLLDAEAQHALEQTEQQPANEAASGPTPAR